MYIARTLLSHLLKTNVCFFPNVFILTHTCNTYIHSFASAQVICFSDYEVNFDEPLVTRNRGRWVSYELCRQLSNGESQTLIDLIRSSLIDVAIFGSLWRMRNIDVHADLDASVCGGQGSVFDLWRSLDSVANDEVSPVQEPGEKTTNTGESGKCTETERAAAVTDSFSLCRLIRSSDTRKPDVN